MAAKLVMLSVCWDGCEDSGDDYCHGCVYVLW